MKRILAVGLLFVTLLLAGTPASAQNRYIVRSNGGLGSVLKLCLSMNCQVQGSLDGNVNKTFLVTSSQNLLQNLLGFIGNLLEELLGIVSVETDRILPLPQSSVNNIPPGLYQTKLP